MCRDLTVRGFNATEITRFIIVELLFKLVENENIFSWRVNVSLSTVELAVLGPRTIGKTIEGNDIGLYIW